MNVEKEEAALVLQETSRAPQRRSHCLATAPQVHAEHHRRALGVGGGLPV